MFWSPQIKQLPIYLWFELENTPSYERVDRSSEDIIRQHEEEMYDGPIDDETRKLPYVYWLPKQHKTPPKSRFVFLVNIVL